MSEDVNGSNLDGLCFEGKRLTRNPPHSLALAESCSAREAMAFPSQCLEPAMTLARLGPRNGTPAGTGSDLRKGQGVLRPNPRHGRGRVFPRREARFLMKGYRGPWRFPSSRHCSGRRSERGGMLAASHGGRSSDVATDLANYIT